MIRSSKVVRSRMARMIGLVVGQLVVLMMLTVGGAWADVGTGSLRAAEGSGCQTAIFVCGTLADLASPPVLASSAQGFQEGIAWVAPGNPESVPTDLASSVGGFREGIAWVAPDISAGAPTALASAPASPTIMLADLPGFAKHI